MSHMFGKKIEMRERCKGVHCVDLGESFHMSIELQDLASIQPRTSRVKFARFPRTDPPGVCMGSGSSGEATGEGATFEKPKSQR